MSALCTAICGKNHMYFPLCACAPSCEHMRCVACNAIKPRDLTASSMR